MKEGQKLWTREELILTMNLYWKTPFGKLHSRNSDIVNLAKLLGRTANAVAYKLVNFASLDPSLKERGIKGASNTSILDKEIWNEFYSNIPKLSYDSEVLLASIENTSVERLNDISEIDLPREGKMREQIIKVRVNQNFFRKSILASYNNTCCITGINQPDLLVAGHIKLWSLDEKNRLNPRNGLALNALHDKAFENGLITIDPDYKIHISSILKKEKDNLGIKQAFLDYDKKMIILPSKFLPDPEFLAYHNKQRFKK
jgi:putative restriction endonuclease